MIGLLLLLARRFFVFLGMQMKLSSFLFIRFGKFLIVKLLGKIGFMSSQPSTPLERVMPCWFREAFNPFHLTPLEQFRICYRLEPPAGIEPATLALQRRRSTVELRWLARAAPLRRTTLLLLLHLAGEMFVAQRSSR